RGRAWGGAFRGPRSRCPSGEARFRPGWHHHLVVERARRESGGAAFPPSRQSATRWRPVPAINSATRGACVGYRARRKRGTDPRVDRRAETWVIAVPPSGLEPLLQASEACALSTELRGRTHRVYLR